MRALVVRDRECAARAEVEKLAVARLLHAQIALLMQQSIDVHRRGRALNAILRQHDEMRVLAARQLDEARALRVEVLHRLHALRIIGTKALMVVVEVRQVDEHQLWVMPRRDCARRIDDPLGAADVGARSPELKQRERPQLLLQ